MNNIKNFIKNSRLAIGFLPIAFLFFSSTVKSQALDAGLTVFTSPVGAAHAGLSKLLKVTVRNYGNATISSVKIGWKINGVDQTDVVQSISLPAASNTLQISAGSVTLSSTYIDALNNTVVAYVKEINNTSSDVNAVNDTISATFGSPLVGGVKTIGNTGSDYKTFSQAINALVYNGLSNNITFKVKPGSYTDNIDLDVVTVHMPNGTKNITIESLTGLRDVILISESAQQVTVKLNGVDRFTLNNLRLINRNIVTGIGVQLTNGANNCTIKNCEITVDSISNAKGFVGILGANMGASSLNYVLTAPTTGTAKYLTLKYNKISGGYYGIALLGSTSPRDTSTVVDSNYIQQTSYYGVYLSFSTNAKIRGNKVFFRPSADVKSTGYLLANITTFSPGNIEIVRNYVTDAGQYGMFLSSVIGTGAPSNKYVNINNNMIAGGFYNNYSNAPANTFSTTETPVGLYLNGVGWANIFFNSVLMDAPSKTGTVDNTTSFYVNGSPAVGSLYVYNNIFYNANKGYAYYNGSATNSIIASDNNDNYVALLDTNANNATGFAWYGGVARVKPSEFMIASLKDKNSVSLDPLFFSNSDLHTLAADLNQKGSSSPLSQAQFDFDGEVRDGIYNANPPDIGCDEYGPGGNDYAIIGVTPDVFRYKKPTNWSINVRWQGQGNGNKTLFFKYKINGVDQLGEEDYIPVVYNRFTSNFKSQSVSVPIAFNITRNDYQPFKLTVYFVQGSNIGDLRLINDSITVDVCVGLEGLFTIDPLDTRDDTTFNSFQEVYDYLKCGVSGPTVIQIADGSYDEQINLWKVRNSSATNTITFKSKNNVFATKLTYANGTAENHATVLFNNAQYITLRDLTIENRSTSNGTCVQFSGNSKFNTLRNNIIKIDSTRTDFQTTIACVVATKLGTLFTGQYAVNATSNTIIGNKIFGGYYGIAMFGADTDRRDQGNIIQANTITSFHKYGIYLEYSDTRVYENIIAGKFGMDVNGYGIFAKSLGDRAGAFYNDISRNRIFDITYQGIQLFQCLGNKNIGAKKSTFVVSNNMIGGGFTTYNPTTSGIFLNSSLAISILHNTIYMDAPRTSATSVEANPPFARCLIVNSTNTDCEALNNILYSRNGAIPMEYYTATGNTVPNGLIVSENNLYYTWYSSKNTPLALIRRTRKTQQGTSTKNYTFSQLSQAPLNALTLFRGDNGNSARDRKSLALPVEFEALPYNFHTYDLAVESKAAGAQDVIDDIDNQPRKSKTPDIGADEFTVPNYDLDVNSILNTVLSSIKPNQLQVKLRNRGKYPLDNVSVVLEYKVTNPDFNYSFTSKDTVLLNMKKTGSTQIYKFKKRFSTPTRGYYNICVEKISGLTQDTVFVNDKMCKEICTGIEGHYYIGFGSNIIPGTDQARYFSTIQHAFDSVYCGIADDTYFNINPRVAPYVERILIPKYLVNLDSPILTVMPYNTTSNTAVTIQQPTTPVGDQDKLHYTVRFNGSNFVHLLNLNIKNTGVNFGTAVHFTKNANNNAVEGCKIETNIASTNSYFYPIAATSSTKLIITDANAFAKNASFNRIARNQIIGGFAGIALLGASVVDFDLDNIIDSNIIQDFYQYGIYTANNTINRISFNQLNPRGSSAATCVSISYNFAGEGGLINANKIVDSKQIGIKLYGVDGFVSNRCIVSNNWITHAFGTSVADTSSAILIKRSSNIGLYFNSIRYNGFVAALNFVKDSVIAAPIAPETNPTIYYFSPTNIHVKNNIVMIDSVSGAPRKPYAIFFNTSDPTSQFNHNAYFTGYLSKFAFYPPRNQRTFEVWQQNTANDLKSYNELPKFVSGYDLHFTNNPGDSLQFDKKGEVVAGINRDFTNRKRSPRTPDIGSLEYEKQELDVSLLAIANEKAIYGSNTFTVKILNDGNQDLSAKTIQLQYSVDSGINWIGTETVTLKDLKNRYDEQMHSFNLKYIKNDFLVIPLCVRIVPTSRLTGDTIFTNEVVCKELCVGLERGTYTIGKSGTEDFPTIQQAVVALICGFDSSIVFKISPGTYNERFSIPSIHTASDTTVVFESSTKNAKDVILEYTNTTEQVEHHVAQLDGSKYITFRHLTFASKAKARASGIHIADSAKFITIENCIFNFDSTSPANTLVGVLASGKIAFTDPASASYNTVRNCEFNGGAFGVRLLGLKNNAFSGPNKIVQNKFRKNYTSAIDVFYTQIDSVSNNDIYMRSGNIENVGMNIYGALTDFIITGNKIVNAQNVGFSMDSCRTISRGLIANNMIAGGFVSDYLGNEAGMLIKGTGAFPSKGVNSSGFIELINNTVLYDGTNDTAAALNILRSNSLNIYNNIFVNYGTGYAFKFQTSTDGVNEFNDADANLLYTRGTKLAQWNNIVCPTIETLGLQNQGNSPFNVSKSPKGPNDTASFDPLFRTPTDLHINYSYLDGTGIPRDLVITDIDNESRNSNTPDIGCDEFFPGFDLSLTEFITPINNATFKDQVQVAVKMKNVGSDIYTAKIKYTFDGVLVDSIVKNYSQPVKFDSTINLLFTKKFQTRQAGPHILAAYTEIKKLTPEGKFVNNDFNTFNDTIKITVISKDTSDIGVSNYLTPLNGLPVKNITPVQIEVTNYGNLTAASYKIYLKVNGKLKETMNITTPLLGKETKEHQFNYQINPDSAVFFDICATTVLFDDVIESNDSNCIVVPTIVGIAEGSSNGELFSVYPNPTSSKLKYTLELSKEKEVEIKVYDLSGRLIREELIGTLPSGKQFVEMDYRDLAEGTYMFVLRAGDILYNGRFVIIR